MLQVSNGRHVEKSIQANFARDLRINLGSPALERVQADQAARWTRTARTESNPRDALELTPAAFLLEGEAQSP